VQQPLVQIQNLAIDFHSETSITGAVKGISLTINRREILALVGESGSGKSVTALSVLRLLPSPPAKYSSGSILFYGDEQKAVDLLKLDERALQRLRGNAISMIFQEPMTSLNPVMTCGEQVVEVLLQHKKASGIKQKRSCCVGLKKYSYPTRYKCIIATHTS
jgi:peptide/nickel transport system ATP-binding protein